MRLRSAALIASLALLCSQSFAQVLLNEVHTVATSDKATPVEHSFDVSVAGTYKITLVDLGAALTPTAPLASVQLAITSGNAVVGTPLTAAGSAEFSATQGSYVIHVVGSPGTVAGSGLIGMQVTDSSNNVVASFSDILALNSSGVPSDEGILDDSFTVTDPGNYQVTLTDLQFPQSLGILTLAIAQQGGSLVTTVPGPGVATAALQPGVTYRIFAVGQLASGVNTGLYGANIVAAGGGAPVYSKSVPVGAVADLGRPVLTAENYTLTVADLQFPAALAQVGTALTLNGLSTAQLTAGGNQVFAAAAGTYQAFAYGLPGGSGTGSFTVSLQSPSATVLSLARAVSAAGGATSAYNFDTSSAGGQAYSLALVDFDYPSQFTSLNAAAVQNGALVGTALSAAGSQNITPAAGPVSLLVFAQPSASGGLFGVDLTPSGAASASFETTQGVGQLFAVRKVSVVAAGNYQVSVSDVGFPAAFANLSVIVTRGTSRIGSIFGGGAFPFPAVPGDYYVNFVAQPGGADGAGTYAMNVSSAPAAPTVTLSSNAPSVASGKSVTLTWTSTGATSCVASGGWTGTQSTSGSAASPAITAATTFTLTCTGDGGSTAQSVNVTVDAASGGGGGALRADVIVFLFGLLLLRAIGGRAARVMRSSRGLQPC